MHLSPPAGLDRPTSKGTSVRGSHVHCAPINGRGVRLCSCGIVTATPWTFTMTSQVRPVKPTQESPKDPSPQACTAIQPISTGLELAPIPRSFTPPVPLVHLPVSLTGPGPSGSPRPTRLRRGCSHPPRHPPDQAAASFTDPPRQASNGVLPPPLENTAPRGAPQIHGQIHPAKRPSADDPRKSEANARLGDTDLAIGGSRR